MNQKLQNPRVTTSEVQENGQGPGNANQISIKTPTMSTVFLREFLY